MTTVNLQKARRGMDYSEVGRTWMKKFVSGKGRVESIHYIEENRD